MAFLFRRSILLFLPLLGLLASCSEDFEVGAPYKPVTVVYGLLNMADTAHYIRIQKAFLDENKSALDLAKVADSNFYNALDVHLKEFRNGTLTKDETLTRVDLNAEGYPKDSGIFFQSPSYAYKSKMSLSADDANNGLQYRYRIVVHNSATGETDSAETGVVASNFGVNEFYNTYRVSFPASNPNARYSLNVVAPDNASVFEGILRFRWVDQIGATETQDSVDWSFARAEKGGSKAVMLSVSESSFYTFLASAMPPPPTGATRKISKVNMMVWAGGNELNTYQKVNGAQGGLTADQIKPIYTNLKGANVYGLFSSRALRSYLAPISDISLDSLMADATTRSLGFSGRSLY